jgi:AcrR family transcriptional regulator
MRVVKEYDERYNEFLDVAQRLFYTQGYEQTSVQAIIDAVGVAKGTFYHYFDSKAALLDEIVERSMAEIITSLEPLVDDPSLEAKTKFEQLFTRIGSWKAENREFLLQALKVLYRDENVLLRNKMQAQAIALVSPLMARIIQQGVREGIFTVGYPEETAEILIAMAQALSESTSRLVLAGERGEHVLKEIERKVAAYERGVERVLGARAGTVRMFDLPALRVWFE